ncbi:MAG TPA: hypothetical protein VFL86_14375 [Burkholderiaceae bacterium]|nr:hypothetical protein [Burkholderiaceae bacterium]
MDCSVRHGLLAAALLMALPLHAQPAPKAAPPDPLDPRAAVPALTHASPLARYKPAGDAALVPWKEANDTTARIGGWRAYAREAHPPEPASPPASAPAASQPQHGHGTHGGVAP